MASHLGFDGGATINITLALCYNDGNNRDEMEPTESGVNQESQTAGEDNYPLTATEAEADVDDNFDDFDPADPRLDETTSDDIRLSDDELEASSLDLATLSADNIFVTDPRCYHGAGEGDGSEDGGRWAGTDNHPAYSERSDSPVDTNPPSRASSTEPTPVQAGFGYGAVTEFKHNQSSVGPYSTQLQRLRPDVAAFLSEWAAAAFADVAPNGPSAAGGQNNVDVGGDASLTGSY
ncbi:hypothetical protein MAPG_02034 [Magnaporthiopsis poae ATCC 64411]|uniref:Uncharacterized protein n=1 Tax=Magnaporthiopsis poae (strain ATCC 64411 / 73-15) TaxID=644358 RepID=A0A0C4DQ96_MAGP6|nr:hypothetical protein MAPG_02034 [Magnaporthiopsis poae ATCC 64411]